MSDVLVGALSVLLATNTPMALTNLVLEKTGLAALKAATATNDPVVRELEAIMEADDAAQEEISRWMDEVERPDDPAAAQSAITLRGRILQRIEPVKRQYEQFLRAHPDHAPAYLAYGSLLNDFGDEDLAIENWEKARKLDPANPAAWNNLANTYAHVGPVEKAFPMYDEAIRLNPNEPVYLHNFGTLVFLFRRDATNYFRCDEQVVFKKAFELYQKAIHLDPYNFKLAADVAQTYYGWNLPATTNSAVALQNTRELAQTALTAWTNALSLAPSDEEREGVLLHFARWNLRLGDFDAARVNLAAVTNEAHATVKGRLARTLTERERVGKGTEGSSSPKAAE